MRPRLPVLWLSLLALHLSSDLTHGLWLPPRPRSTQSRRWVAVEEAVTPDHQQIEAITSTDTSVLIIAGPGTGKSRVLAARLSYLLLHCICSPRDILVLSFTRSAAFNLCNRANQQLEGTVASASEVYCDTFHGFCGSILKKYLHLLSFQKEYMIIDDKYQSKLMRELLISKAIPDQNTESILRQIRLWKELGLGYVGIRKKSLLTRVELEAYEVYPEYQRKLKSLSYLDFGDLLLNTIKLFRKFPNVLDEYRQRFRHVLVDEFQDVSPAQYDILRMLANGRLQDEFGKKETPTANTNAMSNEAFPPFGFHTTGDVTQVTVFCAGDDDQSIYGWRGAQIHLMRRFKYDFPSPRVVHLKTTYRLPYSLCSATTKIAEGLSDRIAKVTNTRFIGGSEGEVDEVHEETQAPSKTPTIAIQKFSSERKEIEWIASQLQQSTLKTGVREGESFDIAVLTRTKRSLKQIEKIFTEAGVRTCYRGRKSWVPPDDFEAEMGLLRLLAIPQDSLAFEVALNNDLLLESLNRDEIQSAILPFIRNYADSRQISHMEAARECILKGYFVESQSGPLTLFISKFDAWRKELSRFGVRGEAGKCRICSILQNAFHLHWDLKFSIKAKSIAEHLSNHDSLLQYFDTAQGEISEQFETEIKRPGSMNIWLMTMMAAKGLEFDVVYLPLWVKDSVPLVDNDDERRLAFVSLTRARKSVHISYAKFRAEGRKMAELTRSQYIEELLNTGSHFVSHNDFSLNEVFTRLQEEERKDASSQFDKKVTESDCRPKKAVRIVKPSTLPQASEVTEEVVIDILSNPAHRKNDVKKLFRHCLSLRGYKRGRVEIRTDEDDVKSRPLSRCSAEQLGKFLLTLLREYTQSA